MFEKYSSAMDTCQNCPSLCQSACPVFTETGNSAYAPWGMMQTFRALRDKKIPLDETSARVPFQCTGCRACEETCTLDVQVLELIMSAKKAALKSKVAPEPIREFTEKFHRHNNPFSKDLMDKLRKILPKSTFKKEAQTVYFASCSAIARAPNIVKDSFELFAKLGIDFVGCYDDTIQCCGYPLYIAGERDEFIDLAEINYNSLKRYKYIIVASPACAHTLKTIYAKYDFDLSAKILTINQFLHPYLKNINFHIKKGIKTKLMYHDPCYMARYLGETELPRELIGMIAGVKPIDFVRNREQTVCCGQGGCYAIANKDSADRLTQERLAEARAKDVSTILTQCPTCVYKMGKLGKKMVVKDVVSYLNDCITGSE